MSGRPRQNRESIKGTHLSIRLTEKEVTTLDALLVKANADRERQHAEAVQRWEQRPEKLRLKLTKPTPQKPATLADVVRALLQQEASIPRLYDKGFWGELKKDTEPLDHLVDLANDREGVGYRWTRETMLRKLVEEEWGRRRLKKVERDRYRRTGIAERLKAEQWREHGKQGTTSGAMPLVVCPHCEKTFELPPR
jgi:hypothetical protein